MRLSRILRRSAQDFAGREQIIHFATQSAVSYTLLYKIITNQ